MDALLLGISLALADVARDLRAEFPQLYAQVDRILADPTRVEPKYWPSWYWTNRRKQGGIRHMNGISHLQAGVLVVEVGVIAVAYLVGVVRGLRP